MAVKPHARYAANAMFSIANALHEQQQKNTLKGTEHHHYVTHVLKVEQKWRSI